MWRYREALPIEADEHIISFDEGFTPLVQEQFAGKQVLLKQDHLFPSGSFKDRGASVLISKVHELGIHHVVEDSSGNAGAAIAAYCAKGGIACDIYVPQKTAESKLQQILQYGALLHRVPGTREDTAQAIRPAAQTTYYASHCWNPYFFHGTKTCIFEIVEQLGWTAPDTLFLPVGNGTLLYGTYLGVCELHREQIIETLPRIIGVQTERCAPLASIWNHKHTTVKTTRCADTIADGIAIETPVRSADIIRAVQQTHGEIITVSEGEINNALHELLHRGYCVEPTSAVALAGFMNYHRTLQPEEQVVIPLTGHGLKKSLAYKEK